MSQQVKALLEFQSRCHIVYFTKDESTQKYKFVGLSNEYAYCKCFVSWLVYSANQRNRDKLKPQQLDQTPKRAQHQAGHEQTSKLQIARVPIPGNSLSLQGLQR